MISENIVIMTIDELHDEARRKFEEGVNSALDNKDELFQRAALSSTDTGVTFSTDGMARVAISPAFDSGLGDCLTIQWMHETDPGHWYYAHFSPARARLIARELIRRAALLESENGTKPIDPIPEKMRKGPIGPK
jgi:hypothetical protein